MAEVDIPQVTVSVDGSGDPLGELRSIPQVTVATRVLNGTLPDGQDNVIQDYNGENALHIFAALGGIQDVQVLQIIAKKIARPVALALAGYSAQVIAEEG